MGLYICYVLASYPSPVKVLENVQEVGLNYDRSEAMTEDGSVYMWGAKD